MANYELLKFGGPDELARAAAGFWLDEIEAANRAGVNHCVALSGGRITQKFLADVVTQARVRKISFDRVHFFWADERCVPPDDPESNFKLAKELLFDPLKIATERIHRLRGEDEPDSAAMKAGRELEAVAKKNPEGMPVLDLIFLGMGEDGHIASLFPESSAKLVDISVPFLVVKNSPKPPPTRISLSYKAIFAAKNIAVLISGAGKAEALRNTLSTNDKTSLARIIATRFVKIFSDINEI